MAVVITSTIKTKRVIFPRNRFKSWRSSWSRPLRAEKRYRMTHRGHCGTVIPTAGMMAWTSRKETAVWKIISQFQHFWWDTWKMMRSDCRSRRIVRRFNCDLVALAIFSFWETSGKCAFPNWRPIILTGNASPLQTRHNYYSFCPEEWPRYVIFVTGSESLTFFVSDRSNKFSVYPEYKLKTDVYTLVSREIHIHEHSWLTRNGYLQ